MITQLKHINAHFGKDVMNEILYIVHAFPYKNRAEALINFIGLANQFKTDEEILTRFREKYPEESSILN